MLATRHIGAAFTSRQPPVSADYVLGAESHCPRVSATRAHPAEVSQWPRLRRPDRTGARHKLVRSHCLWQNGKVDRSNRTLATEWDYLPVFTSNTQRLTPWLEYYNTQRRHTPLGAVFLTAWPQLWLSMTNVEMTCS